MNEGDVDCPHALAMDYPNLNIYWNDGCRKQIEVIGTDGTGQRRIYDGNDMIVANTESKGIAYYNRVLYWTDTRRVFRFNSTTNRTDRLYSPDASTLHSSAPNAIRVVHPSLQPSGQYVEFLVDSLQQYV